jgi:hypothetical protein
MKSAVAVVVLVAAGALAIPVTAAARNFTQVGTATVSGVNSKDATCKPVSGTSATGTATAKNLHKACTDAKNNARARLRGMIPATCGKYVASTKPCKSG